MKKHQPHRSSTQSARSVRPLDPRALEVVRGGHSIISPRDPQSGLPTGQDA
jgi:hypothetical protein